MTVKILISLLLLDAFIVLSTLINAQPVLFKEPLSPRIANYDIDVRLDTKIRLLHGHEVIRWFNKSSDVITELQFHLYLNAFRNNKSTFMKESGGSNRGFKIDKDGWGFSNIKSIKLPNGEDISKSMEFIHPDDDNADDKTVFRLLLSKPLSPGDSIILNIDFTAVLPQPPFARSGAKEEYYFVGQWFPKVGVYDEGKWNCHQYHSNSEFFADFGVYNVKMTVPEKNIVGATGVQVDIKNNGDGTTTHFYRAEDVHDFAWTTSPEFIEFKGKSQDVDILVLMQPDHAYQGQRHLDAAKVAVEYFQDWYGDYPYPNLTVVDPRRDAGGSGGMEYPTLITAGTIYGLPEGILGVEMVIIHEFGHNYWYHIIASNEFEESWMDEGINTYTENEIMADRYGEQTSLIDFLGIKISDLQFQRAGYLSGSDLDPTIRKAWEYYPGGSYGINSYQKPGILLKTLENYLGKETMLKIMRAYFERWKFKHPKTQDFIAVVNDVSGQNLNWFFDQALFSNAVIDYSVDRVRCNEASNDKGFDYTLSTEDTVSEKELTSEDRKDSSELYVSEIFVRRLGSFKFPVEVEVKFENGEKIREKWDGVELWKKFKYTKPVRLVSAIVDPDNKIPMDINSINNSRTIKRQTLGVNKLSVRFLFWMQFLIDQPESLNLLTLFPSIF